MLTAIWNILLELAPWLLLGAAVAGALHVLLPPGFVPRHLSGPAGVLKAVAFGVPMPLCSCGVIPAGLGLKKDGASDGAAVGFLVSTPQTGVDSILVSAAFLGWPFALFKVGAAALTGVAAGFLTDAFGGPSVSLEADPDAAPQGRRTLADGWHHGVDVIRTIWRWVVFGVVLSAGIQLALPDQALADTAVAGGVLGSLLVLLVALPLYVCATASVPIAASLIAAGLPTGSALVFLMAGPATNVATIGAVLRGFGSRVLAIYLATVAVGSITLGLAFDALFGATVVAGGHHEHATWWGTLAAVVLVGAFAAFALEELRGWLASRTAAAEADPILELDVSGMSCGGCARRLDGKLRQVEGVTDVQVSHENGRVVVRGLVDPLRVREAVVDAGYTPR